MAVIIDHVKCCYASGICNCVPASGRQNSNPLTTHPSQKCCVETCPFNALTRNDRIVVDVDLCNGCGECIKICCSNAISMI